MNQRLLTIQDISCVGQCSVTVALPVISACGIETAILPSAVLSTHTGGFTHYTFHDLTEEMPQIKNSWIAENLKFDAFYTGYVCPSQINPILDIINSCGTENAIRFVDPVMADHGKLYAGFQDDFPMQMKQLCIGADYLIPNLTEAAFLLGQKPVLSGYSHEYIENMVKSLYEIGCKNIILTGVSFDPKLLGIATYDGKELRYYFNPYLPRESHGTGDLYASVFAGAIMRGYDLFSAAALGADMVCLAIESTDDEHWYGVSFEKVIPTLTQRLTQKP